MSLAQRTEGVRRLLWLGRRIVGEVGARVFSLSYDFAPGPFTTHALRDVVRKTPLDRILVETDSPFLAPVPHRGKVCEPAFVRNTAQFVADLRGESLETLATATTANFYALFSKARP